MESYFLSYCIVEGRKDAGVRASAGVTPEVRNQVQAMNVGIGRHDEIMRGRAWEAALRAGGRVGALFAWRRSAAVIQEIAQLKMKEERWAYCFYLP